MYKILNLSSSFLLLLYSDLLELSEMYFDSASKIKLVDEIKLSYVDTKCKKCIKYGYDCSHYYMLRTNIHNSYLNHGARVF